MSHIHDRARPRVPLAFVGGGILLLLVPVIGCMAWLWLQWRALALSYPLFTDAVLFVLIAAPLSLGVGYGVAGLMGVHNRWSSKPAAYADKEIAHTRARVQIAPLASSFTYHTEAAPALALPEPAEQIEVIKPMTEWMPWIDEQPHTLLGGKTKAGKTWLATALLERRIDNGSDIFIIDPHSSDWMGLPTAGGSGIPERKAAIKAVLSEYLRRMGIREEHKRQTGRELPHDYFDPLVVLIDEANAMLEELAAEWKTVLKQVASGSRKVGIALLMLAQSPLVEDLGISGAMRENFSRIALDERTVQTLIDSERDRARKLALQAAFKTMERPAAAQIGPHVWLLDRRGLSPGQASSAARIWAGWDFDQGCQASSVSPQNAPTEPLSDPHYFDNENNDAVINPGAGVAPVATVALSAAEIANIATLLMTLPTSEVVKRLDGYNSRNYRELKNKVETVRNLIEGGER